MMAAQCWGSVGRLALEKPVLEAGVFGAVVAAMQAHPRDAWLQLVGCGAMHAMCNGEDTAVRSRAVRDGLLLSTCDCAEATRQAHMQRAAENKF